MDYSNKSATVAQTQMDKGKCPECGSKKTSEQTTQTSPNDFEIVFICKDCGFTATS